MMASLTVSWIWFFVVLTGSSNGYATKRALDPRRAYNVNPSTSNWEIPASGFVKAESGSSAALNPVFHSAPHAQSRYIQPSSEMRPVPAGYSSNKLAAPIYLGHDGSSPASSTKLSAPDHQMKDGIEPSGPLSGTTSSTLLGLPGLSNASPQHTSFFKPGDTSYRAKIYDHGSYESETEERPPLQYTPLQSMTRFPIGSMLRFGPFVDGFWFGHPYIDRVLLARKHPLGTYKLSSNIFEHGKNHRHDTIIVDGPSDHSTPKSEKFPEGIKRHSQPGQSGYGLGGEVPG